MLQKLRKLATVIQHKLKYPDVIYHGAPSVLRLFGITSRRLKKGFFSQQGQDELLFTEFFKSINSKHFPKLFIDIGANHPFIHSNSYFFEKNQGYKVLAIDAIHEIHEMWTIKRPSAKFVECAVGAINGETSFDVIEGGDIESMFSSVSGASQKKILGPVINRTVQVRRISDILVEHEIQCAGIVSMDIEGYEFEALQGIDFSKFFAYIFIIENNGQLGLGDNKIRDMMIRNGYIYYARIWNLDDIFVHPDIVNLDWEVDLE